MFNGGNDLYPQSGRRTKGSFAKKGAGVGLKNIEERLKLIYHQNNLLEVKKEKDIFEVTLYIPIEEN